MTGHLAYRDGQVIGWCNAAPWNAYLALADLAEPNADEIGAIVCFVIAPGARRQGVAQALLDAACDELRDARLKFAMAKPVHTAQGEAANHSGHLALFLAAGFDVLRETAEWDMLATQ
jgi:GNAT superfamily N-acetyltransferase